MLLTVKEVAAQLRTNTNYVYELINSGLLASINVGSKKVRQETLDMVLETYEGQNADELIKARKERNKCEIKELSK